MGHILPGLVATAVAVTSSTSATAAPPLQAVDRWTLNFDDAQCFASRTYQSATGPIELVVKAPAFGDAVQVTAIRAGGGARVKQLDGQMQADADPVVPVSFLRYALSASKSEAFRTNLSWDQFAPVKVAKQLRLTAASELNETFALSGMTPLMKVMGECVADLRTAWNVVPDGDAKPNLRSPAKGTLTGLLRWDDYPEQAVDKEQEGRVAIALLINEQGRVADCQVVSTGGSAVLDVQTCAAITRRAKFEPAIGLDGKPAKDSIVQRIVWRLN